MEMTQNNKIEKKKFLHVDKAGMGRISIPNKFLENSGLKKDDPVTLESKPNKLVIKKIVGVGV